MPDPLVTLLSDHAWRGAFIYIAWKFANKALGIWKETMLIRLQAEVDRHASLTASLERLSVSVEKNTLVTRKQGGTLRHLVQLITEWGRPSAPQEE